MSGRMASSGITDALDASTGRATVTLKSTYLALLTADCADNAGIAQLAEITTAGYTRQPVTWTAPTTSGTTTVLAETHNQTTITFGPFTADPPNIVAAAVVDIITGTTGTIRWHWLLDVAKDPALGESLSFSAGAVVAQQSSC